MSQGNRLHHLALRGCLIAAFALASAVALAQEPKSPNVADEPSPEPAQQEAQPAPTPVAPAPKVDAAEDQEPDRDPIYYPREDLDAQRRMAVAAEGLVSLTNTQIIIASIGSGLVLVAIAIAFWAALEARRAAIATARTVKVTSDTAERQLRAYVHISQPTITLNEDGTAAINIRIENAGRTPAHHLIWWEKAGVGAHDLKTELRSDNPDPEYVSGLVLQAGGSADHDVKLNILNIEENREAIANSESAIFIYGNIKYRDIFNKEHTTRFQLAYSGPWEGTKRLATCEKGNEAD